MKPLMLTLLLGCASLAQAQREIVASTSVTMRGITYESTLFPGDLKLAPTWKSETSPLPYPAKVAEANALEYAKQSVDLNGFPHGTEIVRYETSLVKENDTDKWYYSIKLMVLAPGSGGQSTLIVYVLLSGKIIPIKKTMLPRKGEVLKLNKSQS